MDLLPVNFYVLRFCGVWKEHKDGSLIVRFISFCCRFTMAALIYYFTISEIIDVIRMQNNVENLTEGLFIIMSFIAFYSKYLNFLMRQRELRALLNCFRAKLCQPRDSTEISILKQYNYKEPLVAKEERSLPCKTCVTYSIATFLPYVLTYLQQSVCLIFEVLLDLTFDTIVYGFIIQTCGQIEILCYRLTEAFRFLQENEEKKHSVIESFAIAECVKHHVSVYDIINRIQALFAWTTTILFSIGLITICTNIYQMSTKDLFSPEFFSMTINLGAIMTQIFVYCWFGNELDLKSKSIAHVIYTSDWTIISAKQRKNLLFVMMMSQRGRILSFYGFYALILNTFTWVVKTSYSAFNLLQHASN